ncbi:RagB/SusD family nutrient uptake outer membrane protein [Arcticibacter tournemirensis]
MKRTYFKSIIFLIPVLFLGCEKSSYLTDSKDTGGSNVTEQQFWQHKDWVRNFLNNIYTHVPDEYNMDGDGAMLASASDEAVNSNPNSSVTYPNGSTWGPARTFNDVYGDMYTGIRKTNLFIEHVASSGILPENEENEEGTNNLARQIQRSKGQAFFLRALFHFELVKRYGAIPLVTRVIGETEDSNLPRNTYQECVDQIVRDCDSAITLLPLWTGSWTNSNKGRATQTAAMALKSRMLLYAASPLNNPSGDQAKWRLAADAANQLIAVNKHKLHSSYSQIFLFGQAAYNDEVIFASRANNRNDIEQNNAPISYSGAKGRLNPTQEIVDAFETKNGTAPSETNPALNRDPRFDLVIVYNGKSFKNVAVQTYVGGKDGLNLIVNATRTGYYMKKFMNEGAVTWNVPTPTNSRRPWVLFRYAEILLNYAEAVNELVGPDVLPAASPGAPAFTLTARQAVNLIRDRTGIKMPLIPLGQSQDQMRERIKRERRIELCFEGYRFYDVRRWKEGETYFNKPVTGMQIVKNADNTFSYQRFTVENRVFQAKNYWFPFSINDINRQPALTQNPGY